MHSREVWPVRTQSCVRAGGGRLSGNGDIGDSFAAARAKGEKRKARGMRDERQMRGEGWKERGQGCARESTGFHIQSNLV